MNESTLTTPKERPLLFSAAMVKVLLKGRKTQTRRVVNERRLRIKLRHCVKSDFSFLPRIRAEVGIYSASMNQHGAASLYMPDGERLGVKPNEFDWLCPYGEVGSQLWVRETVWQWGRWASNGLTRDGKPKRKFVPVGKYVRYVAQHPSYPSEIPDYRRIVHAGELWVKRPAIFMPRWASRITLEITDICVQRIQSITSRDALAEGVNPYDQSDFPDPVGAFRDLWDSINAKSPEKGWCANPWVWYLSFKVLSNDEN